MREVTFASAGERCAAWHLEATTSALRTPTGRPCVVMAHGFGGTRDTGLKGFADAFADAGLDVLLFDYRGFGASGGVPRQRVSWRAQRDDYRAAVAATRGLDGVDPERIVLWGTSYSGGHVVAVAAGDPGIAAVVALTPAVDGAAVLWSMVRHDGPLRVLRLSADGMLDLAGAALGRAPRTVPTVGPAGSTAVMANDPGAVAYPAIAGPTWRNEVCARSALGVGLNRPTTLASRVQAPMLVQVGERDTVVPPAAAEAMGRRIGAEVRHYDADHFDVYEGPAHERVLDDQLAFLRRLLGGRLDTAAPTARTAVVGAD
jgi:pimeloyl-ACP methyl ester carboxylesterase